MSFKAKLGSESQARRTVPGGEDGGSVYSIQLFDGHLGLMTQQKLCLRASVNKITSLLASEVLWSTWIYAMGDSVNQHWPCVSLSLCPPGDYPACTSSTRAVWTNGWPPAGSVQSVGLTSKHSWTLTADEISAPLHSCQSPSCGSCFIPPRLAGPPPVGCFCQMSPDFMWHHHPSDSRFTEPSQDN